MSAAGALQALLDARNRLTTVSDKDWAAATGLIIKKLLISAGQTADSVRAIRETVGEEIFEAQLKSLTHYQARLLARRLDKSVPDLEVSTAGAAIAWVRLVLNGETPVSDPETETPAKDNWASPASQLGDEADATDTETASVSGGTDDDSQSPPPPASGNPYFGRRSFRT